MGEVTIRPVEGEARIEDLDLAMRLGFSTPANIRKLIKRHEASLTQMGHLATVTKTPESLGLMGRPATAYYLNRKQAIFITAKSETAEATDITIEIIERFDAYERGAAPALPAPDPIATFRDAKALRSLLLGYTERVVELEEKVGELAPKAEVYDQIAGANGDVNIGVAAKTIGVPPNTLRDWMRRNGWIYRRAGGPEIAYQTRMNAGLLSHKLSPYTKADGEERVSITVMVTPKGVARLAEALRTRGGRASSVAA